MLRIWLESVSLKSGDYLRVHDGPSESSRMVAQYNSSSDDDTYFISSGRSLWLELRTGLKITYYHSRRLTITYKALDRQGKKIFYFSMRIKELRHRDFANFWSKLF